MISFNAENTECFFSLRVVLPVTFAISALEYDFFQRGGHSATKPQPKHNQSMFKDESPHRGRYNRSHGFEPVDSGDFYRMSPRQGGDINRFFNLPQRRPPQRVYDPPQAHLRPDAENIYPFILNHGYPTLFIQCPGGAGSR